MSDQFAPTSGGPDAFLEPYWRDELDARRSMWKHTPDSEYPDGYIGTIHSRRGDRLLDAVKKKLNERVYDRGVHKGERVQVEDYFWPDWIEPLGRKEITRQLQQRPWAPDMSLTERLLVNDGKTDQAAIAILDPNAQAKLRRLGPGWR